ncbi:hypothetical protein [Nocardia donostiensis]|nr:hypothetical protein [Nocardia donostiensis]
MGSGRADLHVVEGGEFAALVDLRPRWSSIRKWLGYLAGHPA